MSVFTPRPAWPPQRRAPLAECH